MMAFLLLMMAFPLSLLAFSLSLLGVAVLLVERLLLSLAEKFLVLLVRWFLLLLVVGRFLLPSVLAVLRLRLEIFRGRLLVRLPQVQVVRRLSADLVLQGVHRTWRQHLLGLRDSQLKKLPRHKRLHIPALSALFSALTSTAGGGASGYV
jgi:hypothetical protein